MRAELLKERGHSSLPVEYLRLDGEHQNLPSKIPNIKEDKQ